MARKMTPGQLQAAVRKAQRERNQAIDKYNREARRHNDRIKKAITEHNRDVRAYNAQVRAHNTRVENHRRRLEQEIRRLNSRPAPQQFVEYRASVGTLARAYGVAESQLDRSNRASAAANFINLASADAANSAYLLNAMDGDGAPEEDPTEDELRMPSMEAELSLFGEDLVHRWAGALFSLSPLNPDAARHFCTSAREVLISMLDHAAPDSQVVEANPDCPRTEKGTPTRRAKVSFLLQRSGVGDSTIEDLIEADIENVLTLFRSFNDGTHGHAGRFTITQLNALRMRVESAIRFIHTLCAGV